MVQKFKMGLTGIKSKFHPGCIFFWKLYGIVDCQQFSDSRSHTPSLICGLHSLAPR